MAMKTIPNSIKSSSSTTPTMAPAFRPDDWETIVGSSTMFVSVGNGEGLKEDSVALKMEVAPLSGPEDLEVVAVGFLAPFVSLGDSEGFKEDGITLMVEVAMMEEEGCISRCDGIYSSIVCQDLHVVTSAPPDTDKEVVGGVCERHDVGVISVA